MDYQTIDTTYATYCDVDEKYSQISRGGWFVLETEQGAVAITHGVKSMWTFDRVGFFKRDLEEIRAWLAKDDSRTILCCYSAFLPEDLRKRALIEFEGPLYLYCNGCKYLKNGKHYIKVEYTVDFDDVETGEYWYDEDDTFIYGTKFELNF